MNAILGVLKFVFGVLAGAVTGAAVATFIVTRDGQQTVQKLRGVVEEMIEAGKAAQLEEEARMEARRRDLIGEVKVNRSEQSAERRAVQKAKAELKKEAEKAEKKNSKNK